MANWCSNTVIFDCDGKVLKNIQALFEGMAEKEAETKVLLKKVEDKGVSACLFNNSEEAIEHSKSIGLIR